MLAMHAEDSADDAIIAEQLGHHAVTLLSYSGLKPYPAYQWLRHRIPNANARLCVRPLNSS